MTGIVVRLAVASCFIASLGCVANLPLRRDSRTKFESIPPDDHPPISSGSKKLVNQISDSKVQLVQYEVSASPIELDTAGPNQFDLETLESIAEQNSPALREAKAKVCVLEGKRVQVGLRPNPQAGYFSSDIGEGGTAGQQGGFISQTFIRGGKLPLNRSIVCKEIEAAKANMEIERQKLLVAVRQRYFDLLIAQEKIQVVNDFKNIFSNSVDVSDKQFEGREISKIANLQTRLQLRNITLLGKQAKQERLGAQQRLSAIVFDSCEKVEDVVVIGSLSFDSNALIEQQMLQEILCSSPEIAHANALIEKSKCYLKRQFVEPIRDVQLQTSITRGNATGDNLVAVQVGVPLLINDRNQGNIAAAKAQVCEAKQRIQRIRQDLSMRFARAWQTLQVARTQIEEYQSDIIPAAKENLELVEFAFREGEIGYLDLISAQQTALQANLGCLEELRKFWSACSLIEGKLLRHE